MLKSNLLGVTLNGIQKRGIIKYTSRSRKKYRCNTADSEVLGVALFYYTVDDGSNIICRGFWEIYELV